MIMICCTFLLPVMKLVRNGKIEVEISSDKRLFQLTFNDLLSLLPNHLFICVYLFSFFLLT